MLYDLKNIEMLKGDLSDSTNGGAGDQYAFDLSEDDEEKEIIEEKK